MAFYLVCIEAGVHLQLNDKAFQTFVATLGAKCPTFMESSQEGMVFNLFQRKRVILADLYQLTFWRITAIEMISKVL